MDINSYPPTKTEQLVLSILAYCGGNLSAGEVIILVDYIKAGNEDELASTPPQPVISIVPDEEDHNE